jgi:hypothetical protein
MILAPSNFSTVIPETIPFALLLAVIATSVLAGPLIQDMAPTINRTLKTSKDITRTGSQGDHHLTRSPHVKISMNFYHGGARENRSTDSDSV